MAATAAKVCTVCNVDCADRPRVKDEFGRYTCRACLDALPPAKADPDGDGPDLRSAAMMEAKSAALDLPEAQSCPKCHGFLNEGQRLCMRCGFDRKRGAKVVTRVEKVKEEKSSTDGKRRALRMYNYAAYAILAVTLGIGAASFISEDVAFICLLASFGILGLVGITTKICQAIDGDWVWFIVGWFIGIVDLVWVLINWRTWLKMMFVGSLAGTIMSGISLIMNKS